METFAGSSKRLRTLGRRLSRQLLEHESGGARSADRRFRHERIGAGVVAAAMVDASPGAR